VRYLYQLIKVGLGLGEEAKVSCALFNLSLLGCQSLQEILLQKTIIWIFIKIRLKSTDVLRYANTNEGPTQEESPKLI